MRLKHIAIFDCLWSLFLFGVMINLTVDHFAKGNTWAALLFFLASAWSMHHVRTAWMLFRVFNAK